MTKLGFLSFGHWQDVPGSRTRTGAEVLQQAINQFEGSVIIVSHDRSFLDGIVDKVLEVSPDGTRMLNCNVTEYVEKLEAELRTA